MSQLTRSGAVAPTRGSCLRWLPAVLAQLVPSPAEAGLHHGKLHRRAADRWVRATTDEPGRKDLESVGLARLDAGALAHRRDGDGSVLRDPSPVLRRVDSGLEAWRMIPELVGHLAFAGPLRVDSVDAACPFAGRSRGPPPSRPSGVATLGRLTWRPRAIAPTGCGPDLSRSNTSRRVGSASADSAVA